MMFDAFVGHQTAYAGQGAGTVRQAQAQFSSNRHAAERIKNSGSQPSDLEPGAPQRKKWMECRDPEANGGGRGRLAAVEAAHSPSGCFRAWRAAGTPRRWSAPGLWRRACAALALSAPVLERDHEHADFLFGEIEEGHGLLQTIAP